MFKNSPVLLGRLLKVGASPQDRRRGEDIGASDDLAPERVKAGAQGPCQALDVFNHSNPV
jgi:hypothetical protein